MGQKTVNIRSGPSNADDPESFHQLELENAFRNGTIVEDDHLSNVAVGKVQLSVIKPKYVEKYQGLLTEFSWLDSHPKVITPVKDQGSSCAASYAFTVIAALESARAIENKVQAKGLSEQ